ncbi:MAG: MaoC family dehydratase [Deltaproteobacteria bacterium]|jgi:acyl dehydratase
MTITISGAAGLHDNANSSAGATEWQTMTLERIRAFADATDDHQWIHVDEERIAKESPFGAPIAHGYLTLSLVAGHFFRLIELQDMKMVINYGTNKVRFPTPLKAGDKFRLAIDLGDVTEKGGGWLEAVFNARIEVEGQDKPACAAECLYRFLPV